MRKEPVRRRLVAGAIRLASALLLRRGLAEPVTFAAYDDRLKSAARVESLTVVP